MRPPHTLTQVQQMKLPITRMNIAKDNIHDLIQKDIKFESEKEDKNLPSLIVTVI